MTIKHLCFGVLLTLVTSASFANELPSGLYMGMTAKEAQQIFPNLVVLDQSVGPKGNKLLMLAAALPHEYFKSDSSKFVHKLSFMDDRLMTVLIQATGFEACKKNELFLRKTYNISEDARILSKEFSRDAIIIFSEPTKSNMDVTYFIYPFGPKFNCAAMYISNNLNGN